MQLNQSISFPQIHCKLSHNPNQGLFSQQTIKPKQLILSMPMAQTVSFSNIIRNYAITQQTIKILQLSQNQLIILYLIEQKNRILKSESDSKQGYKWIMSGTGGFVSINRQEIRKSQDDELIIEYAAYNYYLKQQTRNLFQKVQKNKAEVKHIPIFDIVSDEESFQEEYKWAAQFKITRSFGYTQQLLMIPYFDYMNFDPSKNCHKVKLITWNDEQELLQTLENLKSEESASQDSQNQSDQDSMQSDEEKDYLTDKKYIGVVAAEQINKQEELLFYYGRYSNNYLFKWYGYVIENNPYGYLNIYLRNYWEHPMILLSFVQRTTTKFKLRSKKINHKLIEKWCSTIKVQFGEKYQEKQTIMELIKELRNSEKILENKGTTVSHKYLKIYMKQKLRILRQQIDLLQDGARNDFLGKQAKDL